MESTKTENVESWISKHIYTIIFVVMGALIVGTIYYFMNKRRERELINAVCNTMLPPPVPAGPSTRQVVDNREKYSTSVERESAQTLNIDFDNSIPENESRIIEVSAEPEPVPKPKKERKPRKPRKPRVPVVPEVLEGSDDDA